jgi:hypothetical protein
VNSARSRPTKEGVGGESDGLVLCDGACRVVRPCGAEQEAVVGGDGRVLLARRIDASAAGRRRHPRVIVMRFVASDDEESGYYFGKRTGGFVGRVVRASGGCSVMSSSPI